MTITNSHLLKIFFTLIQKRATYVFILSFLSRFVSLLCFLFSSSLLCIVVMPLVSIVLLSSSSPLIFFVFHFSYVLYVFRFSYVCLMPFLRSLFHWEGFCLLSIVPSLSLLPPCSVIYLRFIGKFLFAFSVLSLGWNTKNVKRYDMDAAREQKKC